MLVLENIDRYTKVQIKLNLENLINRLYDVNLIVDGSDGEEYIIAEGLVDILQELQTISVITLFKSNLLFDAHELFDVKQVPNDHYQQRSSSGP